MPACLCYPYPLLRNGAAAHPNRKDVPAPRSGCWIAMLPPRLHEARLLPVVHEALLLPRVLLQAVVDAADVAVRAADVVRLLRTRV